GNATRVWKESWIKVDTLVTPIGPAKENDLDIYVSDLLLRGSREWDKQMIYRLLPCMWRIFSICDQADLELKIN
ncbi:unnamed protein product, partial [Brassica oleracea]